jgi:hypothetical protein
MMVLFKVLTKKFEKDGASQFQRFRVNFHNLIITVRLGCHKFYSRWVPKMLTRAHKTQRMASAFVDFLERYHKDGDEFISHIVRNRWRNLSFICECWNQRAIKTVDAHTFTKQSEKSSNKLMAAVFFDRKGVLVVEFMQKGTKISSQVYCETLTA